MKFTKDDIRAITAEFCATGLFVFTGCFAAISAGSPNVNVVSPSLAFGLTIAILVKSIGDVSGGHINPAVTFSLMWTRNIGIVKGIAYIIAQLAGATLGSAGVRMVYGERFGGGAGANIIQPSFLPGVNRLTSGEVFFAEAMFTALLVFVVFSVAVKDGGGNQSDGSIAPLYIGLTVAIAHFCLVPVSNCSINPARSFGPAVIQNDEEVWRDFWIFVFGPLTGAIIAPLIFYLIYGSFKPDSVDTNTDGSYDLDGGNVQAGKAKDPEAGTASEH